MDQAERIAQERQAEFDALFTKARQADVLAMAQSECASRGFRLARIGRDYFGPCPCGETVNPQSRKFHVTPAKNVWHCFGCGLGGAAIELDQKINGGTALDAARRILGSPFPTRQHRPTPKHAPPERSRTKPTALAIWRDAQCARGTVVENWFRARALDPDLLADMVSRLRFHPSTPWAWDRQAGDWIRAPAMVAPIVRADEAGRLFVRGVHCTYLSRDGGDKAYRLGPEGEPLEARKMWGDARGVACPLTAWDQKGVLLVGEGLETVASVAQEFAREGMPYKAAAVLSLLNLQGGYLRDDLGCASLPPVADPERPPWRLPSAAGDGVLILVDRDMKPIGFKTRDRDRRPHTIELNAEARADLCASLAVQHWRDAGVTNARAIKPHKIGHDFNDQARERRT